MYYLTSLVLHIKHMVKYGGGLIYAQYVTFEISVNNFAVKTEQKTMI